MVAFFTGGFWIAAQAPTVGEKLAEQHAQIESHEKALTNLEDIPERTAAVETDIRAVKWLLITLNALLGSLIGVAVYAGKRLRRTYHKIAQFMGTVEEVPALIEQINNLPCMVRSRKTPCKLDPEPQESN